MGKNPKIEYNIYINITNKTGNHFYLVAPSGLERVGIIRLLRIEILTSKWECPRTAKHGSTTWSNYFVKLYTKDNTTKKTQVRLHWIKRMVDQQSLPKTYFMKICHFLGSGHFFLQLLILNTTSRNILQAWWWNSTGQLFKFMIRLFFFSRYFWIWYTNITFEYFRPHRVLFKNCSATDEMQRSGSFRCKYQIER